MKVICSKENLLEGINIVQKAVSTKTTLPILEGILLECSDNFKLTGNDLEIGIECLVEADIQESGSIVINSRIFGDIIRRLPDSEILIDVQENNVVIIECENSLFEIKGLSSESYPSLPLIKKENGFKISQKIVKDMIKQTIFAVSLDENRPILTGTLVECKDRELTFVSIDGYRLALRRNKIEGQLEELKVVVPGKTLNEIGKILQPIDEEITIYSAENQILFDMGNCKVVSRLLEGEFLNYRSSITSDYETKIRINTKEFLSSIERASLIITSEERRYPVRFNISDDKMIITSATEVGAVKEEIKVEMLGNKLDIGFNPRYFMDALKVIDDELIDVFFATSLGPCLIKPVDDEKFIYLIAAVRR